MEFVDANTAAKEKLSISGRLFAGQSLRAERRSSFYSGRTVEEIDFTRISVFGLAPGVTQMDLKSVFPTAESIRLPASPQNNFNYG